MLTMNRFSIRTAGESLSFYLANRLPCESSGNALQAKLKTSGQWLDDYGILPEKYHASVDKSGYVVYSYHTPIAWLADNTWYVPQVHYSATTTRHHNIILNVLQAIAAENNLKIVESGG